VYTDHDVIFLQEVSNALLQERTENFVRCPAHVGTQPKFSVSWSNAGVRSGHKNSVILVHSQWFHASATINVTNKVLQTSQSKNRNTKITVNDICVVEVSDKYSPFHGPYHLVSFHGDSARELLLVWKDYYTGTSKCILGVDANRQTAQTKSKS
jgi:hypothetical protein